MNIDTQEYITRLSNQIGGLTSTNTLLAYQVEILLGNAEKDVELIEALKRRVKEQDEALLSLREIAHPMNTRKKK